MPKGEKWGSKLATALTLPCEERPVAGRPVIVGHGGIVSSQHGVTGSGIADGAVGIQHLGRDVFDIVAGGGTSGEAIFDGVGTVTIDGTAYAPTSTVYTLTNDVNLSKMIVDGARVTTPGLRIFARTVVLRNGARIDADGDAGSNGSGTTGGSSKAGITAVTAGGSGAGGAGGTGGSAGSNSSLGGSAGTSTVVSLGGDGGDGATGESSTYPGSGGGNGPSPSTTARVSTRALDNLTRLMQGASFITGGCGGGGGGGGGSSAGTNGGGGGSGGAGGGVLMLACDVLDVSDWTADAAYRISANGGTGGNGVVSAAGDGGVGGGGGGGFVQLVYRKLVGASSIADRVTADGGGYGSVGNQTGAVAGTEGTVRIVDLGSPYIPASEIPTFSRTAPQRRAPHLHPGHYAAMNLSQLD